MAKDNTPDQSNERAPVARKFGKFEQQYGGDAVNAHDDRMDSILERNADKLDEKVSREGGSDDSDER